MRSQEIATYRCPGTHDVLEIEKITKGKGEEIISGTLQTKDGVTYKIANGLPDFTYPQRLLYRDLNSKSSYNKGSNDYNKMQTVTFSILSSDEEAVRRQMIELLHLKPGYAVLETAAGTGLNFKYMINAMNENGTIYAQDISPGMLNEAKMHYCDKGTFQNMKFSLSIGNAAYLPYMDDFFDAALSFGGIGAFGDQKRAICEMFRVVRPGGRIVLGDEGLGPWLRDAEYGRVLTSNNILYLNEAPIKVLPVDARDVCLRWIMGGAFYLVDLTVGRGQPAADFDYPIPGQRGGRFGTRYYGRLEGVSLETRQLAERAIEKRKMSMHEWLDKVVAEAARYTLKD